MDAPSFAIRTTALAAAIGFLALTSVPGDSSPTLLRFDSIQKWQGRFEITERENYTVATNHYVLHYKASGHFTVSFYVGYGPGESGGEWRGPGQASATYFYNESDAVHCGTNAEAAHADGGGKIKMLFQILRTSKSPAYSLSVSQGIKTMKGTYTSVSPDGSGGCTTSSKVKKQLDYNAGEFDVQERLPSGTTFICGNTVQREVDYRLPAVRLAWEIYPVGTKLPKIPHCQTYPSAHFDEKPS